MNKTGYYIFFMMILVFLTGCINKPENNKQFEVELKALKDTKAYRDVQVSAHGNINKWLSDGLEDVQFLKDCNWKIDDAVFFNSNKNRCYLLLLIQEKDSDAALDYAYVMYGALENNHWNLYFESLPSLVFPRERFNKDSKVPVSLHQLSALAREEVLRGYYRKDGFINDEYIEKIYTAGFRKRQDLFLKRYLQADK